MGRLDGLPVPLLPVPDQIRVEHARPADAALEEGEVEVGEAARDPAEEEGLGDGVAGGGEMADVVVAEVGRRVAQQDGARAVVEARRHPELAALLPDGIVVVRAVDPDDVVPLDVLRRLGLLLLERRHAPPHEPAQHRDLVAELRHRELQLLDGLFRRVHGDDGGRDHAVVEAAELVGREHVVGAADGPAQPRVLHAVEAQAGGRVDHAEVDAEIVESLVHEARQHGGRAVEDVLAGRRPERLLPTRRRPARPPTARARSARAGWPAPAPPRRRRPRCGGTPPS